MDTCPDCGRTTDTEQCGYCLGLALGMAYHQEQYDRERVIASYLDREREHDRHRRGGGCALVIIAATAVPAVLAIAGIALTGRI